MKLDDFLKVKKVRCVKGYDDCLKVGKEYNVIDISVEIKVKDDEGAFLYWESDHFEPVLDSAENPLQDMELTPEFEAVEPKFKTGDKVYYGIRHHIFHIKTIQGDFCTFTNGIKCCGLTNLCHATQENYELLSKLYPHIKFEAPPKPLSGDELVKAMLTKGIKNVLCLWVNGDKIVIDGLDCKGALVSINNKIVSGLTPIDWCTGNPLTESILND